MTGSMWRTNEEGKEKEEEEEEQQQQQQQQKQQKQQKRPSHYPWKTFYPGTPPLS